MTRDQIVKLRAIHDTTGLRLDTASGLAGTFYGADGSTAAPVTALLDECERSLAKDAEIASLRAQLDEARRKAIHDAADEATAYGRRVPMARMYADRIAEDIRALLSESKT